MAREFFDVRCALVIIICVFAVNLFDHGIRRTIGNKRKTKLKIKLYASDSNDLS